MLVNEHGSPILARREGRETRRMLKETEAPPIETSLCPQLTCGEVENLNKDEESVI